eukprot:SAG22_NODE_2632_length_2354_cov_3.563636_1_plen_399_part_10
MMLAAVEDENFASTQDFDSSIDFDSQETEDSQTDYGAGAGLAAAGGGGRQRGQRGGSGSSTDSWESPTDEPQPPRRTVLARMATPPPGGSRPADSARGRPSSGPGAAPPLRAHVPGPLRLLSLVIMMTSGPNGVRLVHAQDTLCADTNPECSGWAAAGECESNPGYMGSDCPLSCGICSLSPAQCYAGEDCTDHPGLSPSCAQLLENPAVQAAGGCDLDVSDLMRNPSYVGQRLGDQDWCPASCGRCCPMSADDCAALAAAVLALPACESATSSSASSSSSPSSPAGGIFSSGMSGCGAAADTCPLPCAEALLPAAARCGGEQGAAAAAAAAFAMALAGTGVSEQACQAAVDRALAAAPAAVTVSGGLRCHPEYEGRYVLQDAPVNGRPHWMTADGRHH